MKDGWDRKNGSCFEIQDEEQSIIVFLLSMMVLNILCHIQSDNLSRCDYFGIWSTLDIKVHHKLLISQVIFLVPRKFTLRYQ